MMSGHKVERNAAQRLPHILQHQSAWQQCTMPALKQHPKVCMLLTSKSQGQPILKAPRMSGVCRWITGNPPHALHSTVPASGFLGCGSFLQPQQAMREMQSRP